MGEQPKRGLMNLTIKELKELRIKVGDIFVFEGATFNFTWDQVIRLVNYLSGSETLTESSTTQQSIQAMASFLL